MSSYAFAARLIGVTAASFLLDLLLSLSKGGTIPSVVGRIFCDGVHASSISHRTRPSSQQENYRVLKVPPTWCSWRAVIEAPTCMGAG
jgi:hypothetical protein